MPACWIAEHHLSRFVVGQPVTALELIWDQMWRATQFYGRKGLTMNVISAIDLALWDLLGKLRAEPVHSLIGGAVRSELEFYATGPRPDVAHELGFVGGKLPLVHGPAEGERGLKRNLELAAEAKASVPDDFFLAVDAYMALDVPYALRLIDGLAALGACRSKTSCSQTTLGLSRGQATCAKQHLVDRWRARGVAIRLQDAAGNGLLRHPPA